MTKNVSRCLVDNWTLELAGVLIDQGIRSLRGQRLAEYFRAVDDSMMSGVDHTQDIMADWAELEDHFSAVTNLVSAMLLFDNLSFSRNGFEVTWQSLPGFSQQMGKIITGRDEPAFLLKHERQLVSDRVEPGVLFYLALSNSLRCDLLLSPRRSEVLQRCHRSQELTYGEYASDLLATMDRQLAERIRKSGSELLATKVIPNLTIPSLATLVLSQVTKRSEILTATMDLRNSSKLKDFRRIIAECVTNLKSGAPYARLVESVPDTIRLALQDVGRLDPDRSSISIGFSLFFFSVGKEVGAFVPPYLLFLRDLVCCRMEFAGIESHIKRLFEEDA